VSAVAILSEDIAFRSADCDIVAHARLFHLLRRAASDRWDKLGPHELLIKAAVAALLPGRVGGEARLALALGGGNG
jgi:hypothetical protein